MDYYQGVVADYIRADRSMFINTECCIQLNEGNPDKSGPHWYCDALVCDFRRPQILLGEITFNLTFEPLLRRLKGWNESWPILRSALVRDCSVPADWPVRPWLFVPDEDLSGRRFVERIRALGKSAGLNFVPKITTLEMTLPWKYRSWDRDGEASKPDWIPPEWC